MEEQLDRIAKKAEECLHAKVDAVEKFEQVSNSRIKNA